MVRFGVLGALMAADETGQQVALRGDRQRTLLAMLLFHANEHVSTQRLVDALWPIEPPKSYASNLHTYVSRLRDRLGGVDIDHLSRGYRLRIADEDVDLLLFRSLAAEGRRAASGGRIADAATHLRAALAHWRGPVLDGQQPAALDGEVARLEAERLAVFEDRVDAELAIGRHADVIGELEEIRREHPLRERLTGQLMTALQQSGRQADALTVYRRTRSVLVSELGIEPGADLKRIHSAVLNGESATPAPPASPDPVWPVCQLPADIADFSGRVRQVNQLAGLLRDNSFRVPVVVLSGEPGAGKSALAGRVAHDLRADFPDGQLFVPLSRGATPRDGNAVVVDLLRTLGVPGTAIPEDPHVAAALLRSRLADRRVLVVLDDAANPAQVRNLLPGTPGCAVLITSRRRLSGLAGAVTVRLGPFSDAEAEQMLTRMIGSARVQAEPAEAARIAAACGNLPLALRIAGARLALRPHLRLRALADRLRDQHRRLDELEVSDLQVRASLALSYRALTATAKATVRLIGLSRTGELSAWVIAVLAGLSEVDDPIEELVESGMLEPVGVDYAGEPRYRMHDLVRLFARERCLAEDAPEVRAAAGQRLMQAALWISDLAATRMPRSVPMPHRTSPVAPAPLPDDLMARLLANPVSFLSVERINILTLAERMSASGSHREAAQLLDRVGTLVWSRGHYSDLRLSFENTAASAHRADDRPAEALANAHLALLKHCRGQYEQAAEEYRVSLSILDEHGDQLAASWVRLNLANCLQGLGRSAEALPYAESAREWFATSDDHYGLMSAMQTTTAVLSRLGRPADAMKIDTEAVGLARAAGDRRQLGVALRCLAWSRALVGDLIGARMLAEESVVLLRETTARFSLTASLRTLGAIRAGTGSRDGAVSAFLEAKGIAKTVYHRARELSCDRAIAASWIGEGRYADAIELLRECADQFQAMESGPAQGITLQILAVAYERSGDVLAAMEAGSRAAELQGSHDMSAQTLVRLLLKLAEPIPGRREMVIPRRPSRAPVPPCQVRPA